jgi:membrane protease YdiL (CAAX protease family)
MFSSGPLVEWTFALNKQMVLPEFLQGLQEWMQNKEEELNRITKQLLRMNNSADLLVNLVMIAALPAIGEELIFRGCFQNIFSRWTGSYHWGIWLAAILFSTIHVQFYGFIPRMLLGALFGYLFYWGRSIWLPILAHFVNNAAAVITAYVYQRRGQSLDKLDETEPGNWAVYLMSIATTVALLWFIHSKQDKGGAKTTADQDA